MPKPYLRLTRRQKNNRIAARLCAVDQLYDCNVDGVMNNNIDAFTLNLEIEAANESDRNFPCSDSYSDGASLYDANVGHESIHGDSSIKLNSVDIQLSQNKHDSCDEDSHFDIEGMRHDASDLKKDSQLINNDESLSNDLKVWVTDTHTPHLHVNSLLKVLRKNGHADLPEDSRTLMGTSRTAARNIVIGNGGSYYHFGLESGLKRSIMRYFKKCPDLIKFQINFDGVSLSRSSSSKFWPILVAIEAPFYTEPFMVGLFHGEKDPDDSNVFLEPFVMEMEQISKDGISIDGNNVKIVLHGIICDAPARAFVTHTKYHGGYWGCSKCIQQGSWRNHVVFLELDSALRTNHSFRSMQHEEHHTDESILTRLQIDMVADIPTDYMHLSCLGVPKRLVTLLIKGPKHLRLPKDYIESASATVLAMGSTISSEFARLPRCLTLIDKWKATECRLFLLYTGPIVFKLYLNEKYYVHFLALSIGIRILCDPSLCLTLNDYANSLLRWFVLECKELYGESFISYNVHNLIHLANDVKEFGCLDNFSCFKFENYMMSIKGKVRNAPKPLAQVINRTIEEESLPIVKEYEKLYPIVKYSHRNKSEITEVKYSNFVITLKRKDNCCLLKDGSILIVKKFSQPNNQLYVSGDKVIGTKSLFSRPLDSKDLNISVIDDDSDFESVTVRASSIWKKCCRIDYTAENGSVVMPYLH